VDIASRLIAVLLLLLSSPAFALDAIQPQMTQTFTLTCGGLNLSGSSPGAVLSDCATRRSGSGTQYTGGCSRTVNTTYNYSFVEYIPVSGTPTGFKYRAGLKVTYSTPPGCSTLPDQTIDYGVSPDGGAQPPKLGCPGSSVGPSGGQCSCPMGYKPNTLKTDCEQYTCPPSGGYSAITQPDQKVANAGDGLCAGGCGLQPSSWKVGADGQIWATWPFKSTGRFCSGTPNPQNPAVDTGEKNTSNPAPVPCGQNQCPGTVNGATVCVPCAKQQTDGPSQTASSPTGSGDQTTSTSTSCNGISCTTTTTTKDAQGNVIGSIEKNQDQPSFCQENPQSSLCKQSSFGGACAATACEGDAIQCAIAQEAFKRNCQWFDEAALNPLKQKGDTAMNDQAQPADHPYAQATQASVSFDSVIDQTDRLAGGCPSDESVPFMGKSLTLPFSKLCQPLGWLGNLLVGLTMLACLFIVFRT